MSIITDSCSCPKQLPGSLLLLLTLLLPDSHFLPLVIHNREWVCDVNVTAGKKLGFSDCQNIVFM